MESLQTFTNDQECFALLNTNQLYLKQAFALAIEKARRSAVLQPQVASGQHSTPFCFEYRPDLPVVKEVINKY